MPRVAIVTGGARGIGLAISERLVREGYLVVIAGRKSREEVESALASLSSKGLAPIYMMADVSQGEDRMRLVEKAKTITGRIDVLVNNAGVAPFERRDILEMREESWDRVIDTNAKSNMFLTQIVARIMKGQETRRGARGRIVNISSCSAEVSSPNRAEYCVSKSMISSLTRLYADALAPFMILINEVRPGVIESDMTSRVKDKYDRLINDGVFPIKRWGRGEDVASAVMFFLQDDVTYITGSHIDVDGGFHIRRL